MKNLQLILAGLVFIAGCSEDEPALDDPISVTFRQYADEVVDFSSEFLASPQSFSAYQVLGKENVYPAYGDHVNAWTQAYKGDGRQFLVVGYDTAQTVSRIEIYETYFPGAVDTVYIRNASTQIWNKVYEHEAVDLTADKLARILTIDIDKTSYPVDAVRVAVNYDFYFTKNEFAYIEIDAIAISGSLE